MAQEINVVVIGITHMKGTGKASNAPYDFCQLDYLRSANPHFKSDKTEITKAGFEVKQIGFSTEPALFAELSHIPFGSPVTILLEPDINDIQKLICVGFKRESNKS